MDELVGTGTGGIASYDLDNDNVLGSSYTISYAPASGTGQNVFTDLTEATDYTLDQDSGRLNLTGTGVSKLGTNKLYANYYYCLNVKDSEWTEYLTQSEAHIDKETGRTWGSPTSTTEYITGRDRQDYPTTDFPHDNDWTAPDYFTIPPPVSSVSNVYFLNRGAGLSKVWSDDGGTFTDNTDKANDPSTSSFYVFAATPAVDDAIYFGSSYKFHGLNVDLSVVGAGTGSLDWEYWKETDGWTDLTETDVTTGASSFKASGKFTWTAPDSWSGTGVNGSNSMYYVRAKVSDGYSTSPKINQVAMDQDSVIEREIPLMNIDYTTWGKVTLLHDRIPNGTRNIKVVYTRGESSVPAMVTELCNVEMSLRAYAKLTGASYDEFTSGSLGSKAYTQGEQYVNIREVLQTLQKRKDELLNMIGRRVDLFGT